MKCEMEPSGHLLHRRLPILFRHCQVMSCGAQGRVRTTDTAIFNRVLYQLSYLGMCKAEWQSPICKHEAAL